MSELLAFVVLALAAFRVTRLVVEDAVTERLREWVWRRVPPSRGIGYMITCYWCTGFWVSLLLAVLYMMVPTATVAVALVFALSAVVGLLAERRGDD